MANMNGKPNHPWNDPDGDGHDCADCPSDSIWKCDEASHPTPEAIDVAQMLADVQKESYPDLERMARQRRLAGPDGRQMG